MAVTTIKVDSAVRDRLAVLASEKGSTIGELVADLAADRLTAKELADRRSAALAYVQEHLSPSLSQADLEAGRRILSTVREA